MAYYITWIVGVILIVHNFGNILTASVPETQEASRHLFQGIRQFSQEFYHKANDGSDNLICSPMSANMVLAMAAYGARGNTAKQMRAGLHLSEDDSAGRNSYRKLMDTFANVKAIELKLANKIFLGKGVELKPDYKDMTEKDFGSAAEIVDFSKGAEAAATINNWSAEKTNNRIKDVVSPDDVKDASLVLVNALYFKGDWVSPFKSYMTRSKPFNVDKKTTKEVDMMYQQKRFNYGTLPELDAIYVELPYISSTDSDSTTMFIILPNTVGGLPKAEESIPKLNIKGLFENQHKTLVNLWLPKFKIESTINVNDVLEKLGMTDMFTNDANFTGITENPKLKVSKVIQKAFIEVNEKGSEAAAVTAIVAIPMSAQIFPTPPVDVKVDHPFAFILYHHETDTILFQGHVTSPSK
uniref:Teratocyte serpin II n=1 Tax=Cotesia flavipes TaxID=89805 RepID=A0A8K1YTS3_COTFL|nr:teratocyte serpin II [Cotesia flavipes]